MSSVILDRWNRTRHQEMRLDDLSDFPLLEACHAAWRRACPAGGLPSRIDPLDLPREVLPTVMMLDLEEQPAPALLRVRLAGTEVCARHGGELRGKTTHDFFGSEDAALVVEAALAVAASREPSLARRDYVALSGRFWGYTRLIMPLSRDGERVDSFFKVADPRSMGWIED